MKRLFVVSGVVLVFMLFGVPSLWSSSKAKIIKSGYRSDGTPTYRVDIGDTTTPRWNVTLRNSMMGLHAYNARVFAKTREGRWIHKNLVELPQRPMNPKENRPMTKEEFETFICAIEDEREVKIKELPSTVADLPADLLDCIWAVWYWYDNKTITIYLEGSESKEVAEKIVQLINAIKV